MTKLKVKIVNGKETVADPNVKLKAVKKRAENVAYDWDRPKTRSEHSHCGPNKVCKSITRVYYAIDCFSAGLKEYRK